MEQQHSSSGNSLARSRLSKLEEEAAKAKVISLISQWRVGQNIELTPEDEAVAYAVQKKSSWIAMRNAALFVPLYFVFCKRIPQTNYFSFPLSFTINKAVSKMRLGFQPPDRFIYRFFVCLMLFSAHSSQVNDVTVNYQLNRLMQLHSPIGRETRYLVKKYVAADNLIANKSEFEWEDQTHEEEYEGQHADESKRSRDWSRHRNLQQQKSRPLDHEDHASETHDNEEEAGGHFPGLGHDSDEKESDKEVVRGRRIGRRGLSARRGNRDLDHDRHDRHDEELQG